MISTSLKRFAMLGLAGTLWMLGVHAALAQPESGLPNTEVREAKPRTDDHGDPLPDGAIARLGTSRFRHAGAEFVVFSPDGKTIASRSYREVRLWETATGRERRRLAPVCGAPDPDYSYYVPMAFSPDGTQLALGGVLNFNTRDHRTVIELWDVASGKKVKELPFAQPDSVYSLAFSPDSKALAVTNHSNVVQLVDVASGKEQKKFTLPAQGWTTMSIGFAPDGTLLAHGRVHKQTRFEICQVEAGKVVAQIPRDVQFSASSSDGKTLAVGERGNRISVWDATTGKPVREWQAHQNAVTQLALSADSKTVATLSQGAIQLWDVAMGRRLDAHDVLRGPVHDMALSADGRRLATKCAFDRVQLWEADTRKQFGEYQHPEPFHCLTLSDDGQVLAVGSKVGVTLWSAAAPKEPRKLDGASWTGSANWSARGALAFSPDGKKLAAASRNHFELSVWDTARAAKVLQVPDLYLSCVAYAPDGTRIAAGGRHRKSTDSYCVVLWDAAGRELQRLALNGQKVAALAFSGDGKTLAAGLESWRDAPTLRAWDATSGRELARFEQPRTSRVTSSNQFGTNQFDQPRTVRALAMSPDGKTIAALEGGYDETRLNIYLWEVASGKERRLLQGHESEVTAVAFFPDGKLLSSSQDWTVLFWDPRWPDGKTFPGAQKAEALYGELAGANAVRAYQAINALSQSPAAAVSFFQTRLRPATRLDPERVVQLIKDLDAPAFATRRDARAELDKLGSATAPALKKALEAKPSLEVHRQLEELLAKAERRGLSGEELAAWRAIEVLECAGTLEAREFLKKLAQGAPGHRITDEAEAALQRLARK